ncbi:MAG: pentapeptide repeat-containing protein, partial [Hyphomicrobiaceae bacterium]|nr:pentapeptide repeat-containing protein [Hyphomicrobiaceae bacterium]
MVDETRAPIEDEAPVNPYSLLAAVNDSSKDAHMAWLIFLGLMSYLILAVAGVSHKDLLLNSDVPLPILQVKIELTRFFLFAPLVLVLLHLGVMLQHVLLARKTIEFDRALAQLEPTSKRSHPLRLELQNFFFVQALAGPERSPIMSMFLHVMAWLTLVVLPVILIIYIQIVFLPYHHVTITWAHRISLLADIVMLVAMGVFLVRSETSFFSAFWRTGRHHPVSVMSTTVVLILVTLFSFFVATVPDEAMDRLSQSLPGASRTAQADSPGTGNLMGFVMPFLGATSDGSLFGIFRRNLEVSDTDLVVDKDIVPGERTLSLRGRDLRYARLDRSDLQQVDLTGANLDGASLIGTDLRRAWLGCANPALLQDTGNRPLAGCTRARKADFTRAKLDGARLGGIDLSDATLAEAILEQAELANSVLVGANFASA